MFSTCGLSFSLKRGERWKVDGAWPWSGEGRAGDGREEDEAEWKSGEGGEGRRGSNWGLGVGIREKRYGRKECGRF